ncbi:winged helix-turn-helix domain-containing protein [Streptosporangium vulgare]|uniref:Winged helix-turn-helix domain-containing protein n=1 Tax=Streptosporangium vulgare TaxID=46190 RepID=A0ABV5T970_9ACTN
MSTTHNARDAHGGPNDSPDDGLDDDVNGAPDDGATGGDTTGTQKAGRTRRTGGGADRAARDAGSTRSAGGGAGGGGGGTGSHPRHDLDDVIHAPVRLSIMAALSATDKAEFRFLRDTIEISDSLLSKHIITLEEAGYVHVEKAFVGKRPRTWLAMTDEGRRAFHDYVSVLRRLTEGSPQ